MYDPGRRRREQQEAAAWARQQQEAAQRQQRRYSRYSDDDEDAWSDRSHGSDGGVYGGRGGAFAGGIAAVTAEDIQRAVDRKRSDARAAAGRRWGVVGRCRLTLTKPVLTVLMVSALETMIS